MKNEFFTCWSDQEIGGGEKVTKILLKINSESLRIRDSCGDNLQMFLQISSSSTMEFHTYICRCP
jgi:hypothetical protein